MFAAKDTLLTRPSGYQISRSVRLRSSASAYLNRTPAGAGNRKTWTWSGWVKRGTLGAINNGIFTAGTSFGTNNNNLQTITFASGDVLTLASEVGGAAQYNLVTTQVFRDPSAWYHIVVSIDTTQATSSNRIKLYINGTQVTAFSTASYPAQNYDGWINSANEHRIGSRVTADFDGYLTEINFIDGQALTPSSFGETNAITGVWQPKAYSGTYGTNGFYLNFSDNSGATATTIGKDYSGNGNNWTPNNISVTAGTTYDSMLDVPTLYADGGNGRGNYATLNAVDTATTSTLSNGNLTNTLSGGTGASQASTISVTSGKWYWEVTESAVTNQACAVGILRANLAPVATTVNPSGVYYNSGNGNKLIDGVSTAYGTAWGSTGTTYVIGIALDADAGTVTFYLNNTSQGAITLPANTNGWRANGGWGSATGTGTLNYNFGQRPFSYTPPTGFVALNTQNLPAPTISNGASYMAATTYTGTGSALTIANTVGSASFQPDWVWVKSRSAATDHGIYDSVRGVQKQLESNTITAETTETTGLTAFGSTGFTVGALAQMNTNTATYVAWQWKASGSTVSNTSGSITSTVSANTTAGFSIVQFTATGSNATVGHGLGVAPAMVIVKDAASTGNWAVYHQSLPSAAYYLYMNTTAAQDNTAQIWNSTAPTSSVFSIGTWHTADRQIAYCFAAVAGYSAFGSYTGNGSADGPFVYLGFRPRWLMIKRSSTASVTYGWQMYDTSRQPANTASSDPNLWADTSAAEGTGNYTFDLLSNGFKLRSSGVNENASGNTYIYMAFAENPFKLSLAR